MKREKRLGWLAGAFVVALLLAGCKKEESKSIPTVSTASITSIKITTATGGGTIQNDGGAPITERGICWSTSSNPTIADNTAKEGTGSGSFSCNMAGLQARTTYYVRAYATNSLGTSYGNPVSFITFDYAKVNVSNIRVAPNDNFLCTVALLSTNSGTVTEYGVCWGTSTMPTIEGSHVKVSATDDLSKIAIGVLSYSTTYYLRGYAITEGGVGYGDQVCYTTCWGSVTDIDNNTYNTVKIGNQVWMRENLKVTHYRNGEAIPNLIVDSEWTGTTAGAYCWVFNDEATNKDKYGALYNFYTVVDSRNLCPAGWHIPSKEEVDVLFDFCGGFNYTSAGKLSANGSNEFGFTGLSGYERWEDGSFAPSAGYWTSYNDTNYGSFRFYLSGYTLGKYSSDEKGEGEGVRCIKD